MAVRIEGDKLVDGDEIPIFFKCQEDLKNPEYKAYCWIAKNTESDEWPWQAKFGEAIDETVLVRALKCTGTGAEKHVVGLWKFDGGDKPIHDELKLRAQFSKLFKHSNDGKQNGSLSEVYWFKTLAGLRHMLEIANDVTDFKNITKKDKSLWPDITCLVDEVMEDAIERVILDLCARWGKTRTALELMERISVTLGSNISIMLSYVRTAESSYVKEIQENIHYDNMIIVDPDSYSSPSDVVKAIKDAIADGKHVFYYFALTGKGDASDQDDDTCFNRRMEPLLKFKSEKMDFYVDEADFGAKTEKQIKKIQKLIKKVNAIRLYLMTGTRADQVEDMWKGVKFETYKKDYILDVLLPGHRKNAVGIKWHVLDNSSLSKVLDETVCMENFNDMFEIVDGHLKGETYFKQLIRYLFPQCAAGMPVFNPTKYRELSQANIIDTNFATEIWLPVEKEKHHTFKKLLEDLGLIVYVLNGDITNNAKAEYEVKVLLEENALNMGMEKEDWRRGRNVVILSGGMGRRSFSVAEIKNVMFLTNGGEYASVSQGASRGFTPFPDDVAAAHPSCKTCNIVDFRLDWNWNSSKLGTWLAGLGTSMLNDENHMSEPDPYKMVTKIVESSQKISFLEYSWNGINNPIRRLGEADMHMMMQGSRDFQKARLDKLAIGILPELPDPVRCDLNESIDISLPSSGNVKGDSSKRKKKVRLTPGGNGIQGNGSGAGNTANENEEQDKKTNPEWKIQHLNFVWNHKDWFFTIGCNTVYDSLNAMSEERKLQYEKQFGIDMNFMQLLVSSLKDNNFNLEFSP